MSGLFTEPFVSIVHIIVIFGAIAFYVWSSREMHCSNKNFVITMVVLGVSSFYGGVPDTFMPVNWAGIFLALVGLCLNALFILLILPSIVREEI